MEASKKFTPPRNSIARSFDPFNRQVAFDGTGNALPTADNPYALTLTQPMYIPPTKAYDFSLD